MKHSSIITLTRACALVALCCSTSAFADLTVNVDGIRSEWTGTTTCFTEPTNDASGIDLKEVCVQNNNSSRSTGYLYLLYVTDDPIPNKVETYFGFAIDKNKDGIINSADSVWAARWEAGKGNKTGSPIAVALEERDPSNLAILRRTFTTTSNCGGTTGANGWNAVRGTGVNEKIIEIRVAYGCLGLSYGDDNRLIQVGVYPEADVTDYAYYDGTNSTLELAGPPPEVQNLVALSGNGKNTLTWTNPAQHQGVLILRATNASPNTLPTKKKYSVGQTVGNATVVYFDENNSTVSSFVDTGRTNGTRYFYKVFNHHQIYTYSSGNTPSSAGLLSIPSNGTSPSPRWCYSFGFPSTMQPVLAVGSGVFLASNSGAVTANNPDGTERFRPTQLRAAVQGRFSVLPLEGKADQQIIVGDQAGYAYAINSSTGAITWTGNGGQPLGDRIQAQPTAQLYAYSNAAFKAAHPNRDLVFFATRNSNAKNNKVFALSSINGAPVWTYSPGDLDIISGGMLLDQANNRLWIAARSATNTQSSLRVLNTLNGAEVKRFSIGDIDHALAWGYSTDEAYITTRNGAVQAYGLTSLAPTWSHNTGVQTMYAFPTGDGFIASLQSGSVQRYKVNATTGQVTTAWTSAPSMSMPTGVRIEYTSQKVIVGDGAGNLRQVNVSTGALEKQLNVSTAGIGTPMIDSNLSPKRLYVGTMDGRLCAFDVPF